MQRAARGGATLGGNAFYMCLLSLTYYSNVVSISLLLIVELSMECRASYAIDMKEEFMTPRCFALSHPIHIPNL